MQKGVEILKNSPRWSRERSQMGNPNLNINKLRLCLLTTFFLAAFRISGALTVESGTATAGADFSSSPSQLIPPSGSRSQNVFYGFRNLATTLSGSLGAEGWATASWNISQTALTASGSSGQGFNGAYGAGGWIYGWGHASFSATFSLDKAYAYSATNLPLNVSGINGTNGFLPAGVFTVIGTTYGNQGGFSINYQLTPANAAQTAVLNGAIYPPVVRQNTGNSLYYVIAAFIPQGAGMTLAQAANILGVDHFNFVNTIIGAPTAWQWYENSYVIIQSGDPIPAPGLVDPIPQASTGASRSIMDPRIGVTESFDFNSDSFDGTPHFDNTISPLYYNESYVTRTDIVNGNELDFRDSPQMAPGMFQPGDAPLQFKTQLVGEDKNGNIIAYFGSPFYWSSDQTAINGTNFSGMIFSASEPDEDDVGTWASGGITIGVPPATIEWTPATISYGTVLSSNQLDAIASVPGWFTYTPTNGAVLNSGTNTLSVVFTPYDSVNRSCRFLTTELQINAFRIVHKEKLSLPLVQDADLQQCFRFRIRKRHGNAKNSGRGRGQPLSFFLLINNL